MFFGDYFSGSSKLPEEKQRSDLSREKINKDIKRGHRKGMYIDNLEARSFVSSPTTVIFEITVAQNN